MYRTQDILKNTHKDPKFGKVGQLGNLVGNSLCQIWDFYGYSLNTLKYPKMGIRYFFLSVVLPTGLGFLVFNSLSLIQYSKVLI